MGTSDTNHIVSRVPGPKNARTHTRGTPTTRDSPLYVCKRPRFCASGGKNIFLRRNAAERTGKRVCGRGAARVCGFDRFLSFRIFYVLPNKLGVVLAKKSRFAKTDDFPRFSWARAREGAI